VLANRYRLRPDQIAASVHTAHGIAALGDSPAVTASALMSAARAQSYGALHTTAQVRRPNRDWDDIVLPRDQMDQLHEICDHAEYRHVVHREWAKEQRTPSPNGLNALFSGPSGTGKTLAAEIIAGELGLDLATVEIARIVSKYIGETEKNLDLIFDAAEQSNAVLFFDEADAIFGKRSPVKDAHDRYANLEVGYLLQKIENHEGIVILCTNLRSNMDDAFARRLHHVVEFPFPDASLRLQIWRKHLHDRIPQAADLDLDLLARQFDIAGGSIRSIVVNACVFAAAAHQPVSMRHLTLATRREFQKMGRVCDGQTFGQTMRWLDAGEDGEVSP
jgi:SpoVK/Ycf46/Vps4 family AAA+-type ATPase